jgi:ABC-2 type transport system ATP-binding protein
MTTTASSDSGDIEAEHLCKAFGTTVAVNDVSFHVAAGEVIGFLGPNGAGKSTTLRMLTGVFPPTSGRALIAGHDVVRDAIAARRSLGYLPERTALYADMLVSAYLHFIADMKGLSARDVASSVNRAMGQAGLEKVSHRRIGDLSKGYRQRVGIAQALLGEPRVLILDEPSSGLDPEQVTEIRALIRSLGDARRTVVLSTHILPEVEMICSRVIIMARGRILAVDEPTKLEERIRPYREISLRVAHAPSGLTERIEAIPHVLGVSREDGTEAGDRMIGLRVRVAHGAEVRSEIARVAVESNAGLADLRPAPMTLEQIFLALVEGEREGQAASPAARAEAPDARH